MTPTSLYRVFSAEGELLYIGISGDVPARLVQHRTTAPWWPSSPPVVTHVDYADRETAHRAEMEAIAAENPLHNLLRHPYRPPDQRSRVYPMRIPEGLREALQQEAARQDRSLNWLIRDAVREYLARHKEPARG